MSVGWGAPPPVPELLLTRFLLELWAFVRARKNLWMVPILLLFLLFGALIVLAPGSALAPFIYTLF